MVFSWCSRPLAFKRRDADSLRGLFIIIRPIVVREVYLREYDPSFDTDAFPSTFRVLEANKFKTAAIEHDQWGEITVGRHGVREGVGIRLEARGTFAFTEIAAPDEVGFRSFATPGF